MISYCLRTYYILMLYELFLSDDHYHDPEHIPSCKGVYLMRSQAQTRVREVVRICHAHLNRKGRLTGKLFVRILKVQNRHHSRQPVLPDRLLLR
jgi:hypothetical protein